MPNSDSDNAKIFKAFCDENRLKILALLRGGEKCACVLTEHLGMKQSALSYHMKVLVESGIVSSRQEGKWTHYRISEIGAANAMHRLIELTTLSPLEQNDCDTCAAPSR